jgi:hypothetical protein
MPAARTAVARKPAATRSRVTNGADVLPGVDLRSATARRYRDLYEAMCVDQGGIERLSQARLQLIRRFAAASVLAEAMEARLAAGLPVDVTEFSTLASTAVRIAQRIGLDRRARNVTPSLQDYIEGRATIDAEPAS